MKSAAKFPLLLVAVLFTCGTTALFAQNTDETPVARKIVNKVMPVYPSLARTMNLVGTVRLEVLVTANGSVKTIDVKGGNPLLAQSAESAVRVWKWEKTGHESTETLDIKFNP
jgi:TonB family protein